MFSPFKVAQYNAKPWINKFRRYYWIGERYYPVVYKKILSIFKTKFNA